MGRVLTTIASVVAATVASASAATINSANYGACIGQTTCAVGNVQIAAAPDGATISEQTFRGFSGLGVSSQFDGPNGNGREIQAPNEGLLFAFTDGPQFVREVVIAHLFNTSQFSMDPLEVANISALDMTGNVLDTITLTSDASPFTVTSNVDAALTSSFAGVFTLTDLFPTLGPISGLLFDAGPSAALVSPDTSDYSVVSVSTQAVPVPGAALLMVGGLAALGMARRRRA